jgi:hypothetical protein
MLEYQHTAMKETVWAQAIRRIRSSAQWLCSCCWRTWVLGEPYQTGQQLSCLYDDESAGKVCPQPKSLSTGWLLKFWGLMQYSPHHEKKWLPFLGAFTKFRKATITFFMYVYPFLLISVHMEELGSYWTDFGEILYMNIFRNSVEQIQGSLKSNKKPGYFTWIRFQFMTIFLWILHRMRNVSNKFVVKYTFYFQELFTKHRAVCGIISKNMMEPERPQTTWRMHVACWICEAARERTHVRFRARTPVSTLTHTHAPPPPTHIEICNTYCFSTAQSFLSRILVRPSSIFSATVCLCVCVCACVLTRANDVCISFSY